MDVNWLVFAAEVTPVCFEDSKAWFQTQEEVPACAGHLLSSVGGTLLDAVIHTVEAAVILGTGLFIPATVIALSNTNSSYAKRFAEACNLSQGLKHLIAAVYSIILIPFRLFFDGGACCLKPSTLSEGEVDWTENWTKEDWEDHRKRCEESSSSSS